MNDYSVVLGDLENKLARLDAERAEVTTAITAIKKIMGMETPPMRGLGLGSETPVRSPYEGKPVLDASKAVLRAHGRGMGAGAIAKELKASGYKTGSKQLSNTVYRTLVDAVTAGRGILKDGPLFHLSEAKKGVA